MMIENSEEYLQAVRDMRSRAVLPENEGRYWTKEERARLEQMFYEGIGLTTMALELKRSEEAVNQQLRKMKLYTSKHRASQLKEGCGCLCSVCQQDKALCPRSKAPKTVKEDD